MSRTRPRLSTRALACCLLLAVSVPATAQQYRWVDNNGRVQYTDTPPPVGAKNVQKKNFDAAAAQERPEPFALQLARKNAPVKLYAAPSCGPGCDAARALLNQRGIPFSEVSISSPEQLEELRSVSGGTMMPVMLVGNSVQKGYQEQRYHLALDAAGYPPLGALRPRSQAAPPPPAAPVAAPESPTSKPAAPVRSPVGESINAGTR